MKSTSGSGQGGSRIPFDGTPPGERQPVRLLLVDSLPVVHRGIDFLLTDSADVSLVGSSFDPERGVHLATKLLPDIIVLDLLSRGRRSGTLHVRLDSLRKLRRRAPRARCIVFTSFHPKPVIDMALAEHVAGIYSKIDDVDGLPAVIRFLYENPRETYLSATVEKVRGQRSNGTENDCSSLAQITEREMEVLELVLEGKDTISIANTLGISPRTVGTHRSRILHKANVRSFFELSNSVKELAALGA